MDVDEVTYYKATRTDGRDFRTGTVDYGAALLSGEVIEHPAKRIRNRPDTYLSVSVEPADCTGFQWPCRLFRVEPVGRVMAKLDASPNKRALTALRVVEELPAWMALGPNGEEVAALIERVKTLTPTQANALYAAWDAARGAAWDAAWDAVWGAARGAARGAAWVVAWDAAWGAAWGAARGAASALLVKDLVNTAQFDLLYGPWAKVMEK